MLEIAKGSDKLVNIKIVNFKKENWNPEKLPKQGEDSESL